MKKKDGKAEIFFFKRWWGRDKHYYIISILKMKTWGLKSLINRTKVTGVATSRGRMQTQAVWPEFVFICYTEHYKKPNGPTQVTCFQWCFPTVLTSYFESSIFFNVVIVIDENFSIGINLINSTPQFKEWRPSKRVHKGEAAFLGFTSKIRHLNKTHLQGSWKRSDWILIREERSVGLGGSQPTFQCEIHEDKKTS